MPPDDVLIKGIDNPRRKREIIKDVNGLASQDVLEIKAATGQTLIGSFISARISKLGGDDDNTWVILDVDGKIIVKTSYKKAKMLGLTNNPYGIVFHDGIEGVKTLTIGFQIPLYFTDYIKISVEIEEAHVSKIEAVVIWSADQGEDNEPGGVPPPPPEDDFP